MRIKHCGLVTRTVNDDRKTIMLTVKRYAKKDASLIGDAGIKDMREWALRDVQDELADGYELIDETG